MSTGYLFCAGIKNKYTVVVCNLIVYRIFYSPVQRNTPTPAVLFTNAATVIPTLSSSSFATTTSTALPTLTSTPVVNASTTAVPTFFSTPIITAVFRVKSFASGTTSVMSSSISPPVILPPDFQR